MGKVRKDGRQFYKKKITATSAPFKETASTLKAKPVDKVISEPANQRRISSASTSISQQSTTKKIKLKQRKKNLLNKISVVQSTAKRQKQKKKKIKTQKSRVQTATALTDLTSLKNALPSLNDSLPSLNSLFLLKTSKELKTGVPQFDKSMENTGVTDAKAITKAMKTRHNKRMFMGRCQYLLKLMSDESFRQNPREVIATHLRKRRLILDDCENKKTKK